MTFPAGTLVNEERPTPEGTYIWTGYYWKPKPVAATGSDPQTPVNTADIAALQTAAADVNNATEAELQAALAAQAAGDAALQAALDAHALGDASDVEVALIEAALQAQIDTLNTEQATQDAAATTLEARVQALEDAPVGVPEINPNGTDRGTRGELAIVIDGVNTRTRAIPSAGDPVDG